jgi:DNA-directed RNA polymerase subunit RPC12/RpoP
MPAKKKAAQKTIRKKTTKKAVARKPKKVYVCVPCGTEITISKEGMGVTRLMCCGQVMKPKKPRTRL